MNYTMNLNAKRMQSLIEGTLLDTEPEKIFDDITEIASQVCDVPIAFFSIFDNDRQFFKSNIGLNSKEIPLINSFCKIAAYSPDKMLIIEDARLDDRFKNNSLVTNYPNIISYYGVPLQSKAGMVYGTLCVMAQKVKILSIEQKNILTKLSKQIEHVVELRISNILLIDYQTKTERYSKDMEEFASMAAHDLKAPVRAIHSFVTLIEKKYEHLWDIKDKKYIAFIHQSAIKMNSLIQDLLEFSKSTINTNFLESFDLKELILDLFASLTYGNSNVKSVLICDTMPLIFSSKIAFSILFNNLINNGLKYQKENETPCIEISSIDHPLNWIFTVKDNGIGIESEFFEEIFKPFKRLHTTSEFQGNGLGLAACVKIVNHLKGEINVTSTLGQGSIFTLKIPKI